MFFLRNLQSGIVRVQSWSRIVSMCMYSYRMSTNVALFATLLKIPNLVSILNYSLRTSKCMISNGFLFNYITLMFNIAEDVEMKLVIQYITFLMNCKTLNILFTMRKMILLYAHTNQTFSIEIRLQMMKILLNFQGKGQQVMQFEMKIQLFNQLNEYRLDCFEQENSVANTNKNLTTIKLRIKV